VISSLKACGKRIVHCHGVFDLLHIGHLRHFEQAKALGDVLVVTLTADRFVYKGPRRPVFSESLRAEALAALSCVDFVAVSRWPMAVELIRTLKPDFYVKGSDYKDATRDVTGGIDLERGAIEEVGGAIAFTDDITFSSSALINRNLPVFEKEVGRYIRAFSEKYAYENLLGIIEDLRSLRVLVVGEAIVDEYAYCEAIGKSGKEPMLAIKQLSEEKFAGGILAIANHVANFADTVGLVTFLGDDGLYDHFISTNLNPGIDSKLLIRKNSPTIVKRRFIESYFFSKLLSVYNINDSPLDKEDEGILCATLAETVPQYDAVIVVDFGHSMMTQRVAETICDHARFLAINTQSNAGNFGYQTIFKYPRADYVCVTENEARLEVRDRISPMTEVIPILSERLACQRVVITRGMLGSIGYDREQGFQEAPSLAGEVKDRMGAGDAFLSITALCAACAVPLDALQFIGNTVGAQAVATVGHRESISRSKLLKFMSSLLK